MTLIVHPRTQQLLEVLAHQLPQSLLIMGGRGSGLLTIAQTIAGKNVLATLRPQDTKEQIDNENGTISVEMIRRLYDQTRGKYTSRQVVIIDDADRMNTSSQSAFLKLLEEPNSQIHFILTSHHPDTLKLTVRSRLQQIAVREITPQQTNELIHALGINDPVKQAQLGYIASGLPAEIVRLSRDEDYFAERAQIMSDARLLLQADTYQRLLITQKYQTNRDGALQLLASAIQIARRSLSTKPQHGLVTQLDRLLQAQEHIASNYNIRLQLAQFVLQ
ncbi:MAG: AAA family ATPase [Candidatus Saccharimonadales bacterium]